MTTLNTEGAVAHTSSLLLQHRNDLNPTVQCKTKLDYHVVDYVP